MNPTKAFRIAAKLRASFESQPTETEEGEFMRVNAIRGFDTLLLVLTEKAMPLATDRTATQEGSE